MLSNYFYYDDDDYYSDGFIHYIDINKMEKLLKAKS